MFCGMDSLLLLERFPPPAGLERILSKPVQARTSIERIKDGLNSGG